MHAWGTRAISLEFGEIDRRWPRSVNADRGSATVSSGYQPSFDDSVAGYRVRLVQLTIQVELASDLFGFGRVHVVLDPPGEVRAGRKTEVLALNVKRNGLAVVGGVQRR